MYIHILASSLCAHSHSLFHENLMQIKIENLQKTEVEKNRHTNCMTMNEPNERSPIRRELVENTAYANSVAQTEKKTQKRRIKYFK